MRLIVTGGCGFVGFSLARYLRSSGHQVTVLDSLVRRGSEMNVANLRKLGVEFAHGDIRNPEDLLELPVNADCLLECSAQPSVVSGYKNPVHDFRTNVEGVINCLEFCRRTDTGLIFLSSSRVYPAARINALPLVEKETRWDWDPNAPEELLPEGFDPHRGISAQFPMDGATKTIYGASKAAADFFCREYVDAFDLPVLVNRCGVIAGPGQFGVETQGWLTFWALCRFFERPLAYFGHKGKQVRDILFVEDLCRLVEKQLGRLEELSGKVWNVGGGRKSSLSLIEATALMERLMNKKMRTDHQDEVRKGDIIIYISDNAEVSRDLNWSPATSIDDGAARIARWVTESKDRLIEAGL